MNTLLILTFALGVVIGAFVMALIYEVNRDD